MTTGPTPPRPDQPAQWLPPTIGSGLPPAPGDLRSGTGWPAPAPPPPDRGGLGIRAQDPRPRATWRWWEAVLVFFLGLVVAGVVALGVAAVLPHQQEFFWVGILGEFLPVLVLVGWLQLFHKGWINVIGLPKKIWREVLAGVLGGLLVYLVAGIGIGMILSGLFDLMSGGGVQTPQQLPGKLSPVEILLAILLAVVSAPIAEETFFRGVLFRAIRARRSYWTAAIGSSLLFGLAHYGPDKGSGLAGAWLLVAMMFFVGFGLSYIYERRGNIVASMVAHATFNTIGLIFIIGASR